MILSGKSAQRSPRHKGLCIPLTLLLMFIWIGCSPMGTLKTASKTIIRPFNSMRGTFVKRVVVAAPENQTVFKDTGLETSLGELLTDKLRSESGKIELLSPKDSGLQNLFSQSLMKPTGGIDNYEIAKRARPEGIQAYIRYGIVSIEGSTEEKGILFFKKPHMFAKIQLFIEVYDPETAAKILDKTFETRVEVEQSELDTIRSKSGLTPGHMADAFSDLAEEIAEAASDVISEEPWKTFVVAVSDKTVTLASGGNAGLSAGDRFSIFASRQIVEDKTGNRFFVPGPSIAQIQIDSVTPEKAVATIVSGSGIEISDTAKQVQD